MGRPSKFSAAVAVTICERLARGESLRQICRDDDLPSSETVRRWLRDNKEFRAQYAQAREDQADAFADEILDIAHDGTNDWQERELKGGRIILVPNEEHISRSRLRVDSLKWLMSKMAPKKYGDKIDITGAGASVALLIDPSTLGALQAGYKKLRERVHGRR